MLGLGANFWILIAGIGCVAVLELYGKNLLDVIQKWKQRSAKN